MYVLGQRDMRKQIIGNGKRPTHNSLNLLKADKQTQGLQFRNTATGTRIEDVHQSRIYNSEKSNQSFQYYIGYANADLEIMLRLFYP